MSEGLKSLLNDYNLQIEIPIDNHNVGYIDCLFDADKEKDLGIFLERCNNLHLEVEYGASKDFTGTRIYYYYAFIKLKMIETNGLIDVAM